MLLDLKKLFENEEECIPFQFELDLSDTEISGVYPFVSPVQIRGSVQNTAQTVYMTAEAAFDFPFLVTVVPRIFKHIITIRSVILLSWR